MSIIIGNRAENIISNIIGKRINSPEQRLLQGVTALALQPFIDFNNKKADDETRAVSVSRTIGKIVAGTMVGVCVRYACIRAAKYFSQFTIEEGEKFITTIKRKSNKDFLLPNFSPEYYKELTKEDFLNKYDNTIKAIGTILASVSMIFTNFFIDAPLTKKITKFLTPKVKNYIINNKKEEVQNAKAS